MKSIKKLMTLWTTLIVMVLVTSCVTIGKDSVSVPTFEAPAQSEVDKLISRSDFIKAAKAAPEWVKAALKVITDLEADTYEKAKYSVISTNHSVEFTGIVIVSTGWGKGHNWLVLKKHLEQLLELSKVHGVKGVPANWYHGTNDLVGHWVNFRIQKMGGEDCLVADFVPLKTFKKSKNYSKFIRAYKQDPSILAVSVRIWYTTSAKPDEVMGKNFKFTALDSADFVWSGNLTDGLFNTSRSPSSTPVHNLSATHAVPSTIEGVETLKWMEDNKHRVKFVPNKLITKFLDKYDEAWALGVLMLGPEYLLPITVEANGMKIKATMFVVEAMNGRLVPMFTLKTLPDA